MKLEKQNRIGAWSVLIDLPAKTSSFRVIERGEHKVIVEIEAYSSRGELQVFRLHLTWDELRIIAPKGLQ